MKIYRYFTSTILALASAVLATFSLVACNQSQPSASAPAPAPAAKTVATKDLYVTFEGPWAVAPDPKDPNFILMLAPKTKHHRDLYVTASNHSTLASGVYDLSFPGHMEPGAETYDPDILRAKIDPQNAQHVLDRKEGIRYAVRLPRPEAYLPAHRHPSRAGSAYPPDASTEKNYATAFALRYSVASLSGFSLSGTPDTGTFNPLLLQVDTPAIRFSVEPNEGDDDCNTHSRQAFHDLVQLVGLTLYVDFPENPSSCHDKDPQLPHGSKRASLASSMELVTALLTGNLADVQAADATTGYLPSGYVRFIAENNLARRTAQRLGIAVYFFGLSGADCGAPGLGGH
jgi:hypothetical protein